MAETTKRSSGTVKWFSAQKGFGFIAPNDGGEDLFVHQTSIKSEGFRTLSEGKVVEFALVVGEDGRTKAIDVEAAASRSRRFGSRGGRSGGGRFNEGRRRGGGGGGGGGYGRGSRGGRWGGGGAGGIGACFNCGRTGHLARECYSQGGGGSGGGRGYSGGRGGGGGGGGCYNCGEEGHFARDCPRNEQN